MVPSPRPEIRPVLEVGPDHELVHLDHGFARILGVDPTTVSFERLRELLPGMALGVSTAPRLVAVGQAGGQALTLVLMARDGGGYLGVLAENDPVVLGGDRAIASPAVPRVGAALWEWDTTRSKIYWSPEVPAVHGVVGSDEEPTVEGFLAMVAAEDRERIRAYLVEVVERAAPIDFRYRAASPDGVLRYLRAVGDARRIDGRLVYAGMVLDETPARLALEAVQQLEARFEIAARAAKARAFEQDAVTGMVTFFGLAHEGALLPSGDVTMPYETLMSWVAPNDRTRTRAAFDDAIARRESLAIDFDFAAEQGTRHYLVQADPFYDAAGTFLGLRGIRLDVTESHEADRQASLAAERLQEAEARFRIAMDALSEVVWVFDVEAGRVTFVSEAFEQVWGHPREDLYADQSLFIAVVHPDDRERVIASLVAQQRGETTETSYRLLRADGTVRHILDRAVPTLRDGKVVIVSGVATDLTETKAANEILREREATFRLLAEHATDLIASLHPDGTFRYVSPSVQSLLGYTPDVLVGVDLRTLVHEQDRTRVEERVLAPVLGGRTAMAQPFRVRTRDGHWRWFEAQAVPVLSADGVVSGVVATAHDVTDALRMRDELLRSRNDLEDLVAQRTRQLTHREAELRTTLALQVAVVEATGYATLALDGDARVRAANPAARAMLGWDESRTPEMLPDGLFRLPGDAAVHPLPTLLREWLAGRAQREGLHEVRADLHRGDGLVIPVQLTIGALAVPGDARPGAVVVLHDLRPQLEVERAQREAQERRDEAARELQRSLRLKNDFLAMMSHELRTPLTAVIGLGEILAEGLAGPLTERQAGYARTILDSGRHLLALINDILDFSRIESGSESPSLEPVSTAEVVEASLQLVRPTAMDKETVLTVALDPEVPSLVADPRRLRQMLVNLLHNAVKFTPKAGHVTLRTQALAGAIRFTVEDDGPGIAPEKQRKLFQAFSQVDSALSREHGGTGLGLALVKRMAEMHGGTVAVHSVPGTGSRFEITLPMLEVPALASLAVARQEALHAPDGHPLVLIVDDVPSNVVSLEVHLHAAGYRTHISTSLPEALEFATGTPPAAVLLDVQMRGEAMDGVAAMAQFRFLPGGDQLPIVALTAMAMPGDRERLLAAGMDGYVSKPVDIPTLLLELRTLLDPSATVAVAPRAVPGTESALPSDDAHG